MGSVYNLDENGTNTGQIVWTQDLTNVCDTLSVSFTNRTRLEFAEGSDITWNGADWRVLSSRWVYTGMMWQCSALCIPPAAVEWVSFDYTSSAEFFDGLGLEIVNGKTHPYPICMKGDTVGVILRKLNKFSMIQNRTKLVSAYCDYLSYSGGTSRRWSEMASDVSQFTTGTGSTEVRIEYLDSADLYLVQHTPLGAPWSEKTMWQYMFRDMVEVQSANLAEIGCGYNMECFGFDSGEVYVLIKQVYSPESGGMCFRQTFATLNE